VTTIMQGDYQNNMYTFNESNNIFCDKFKAGGTAHNDLLTK